MNSAKGRTKVRNMKEGAPVALSIKDPEKPVPLPAGSRQGHARHRGGRQRAYRLAGEEILRQDKYPWSQPGDVRVTFEITPAAVQAMG